MRRGGLVDGDGARHHVREHADAEARKAEGEQRQRKQERPVLPAAPQADQKPTGADRDQQRHLGREQNLRPGEPALVIGAAEERRRRADQADAGDQSRAPSLPARRKQWSWSGALGLHDQPGRAEQGIADDQADADQQAERRQPVPPAAGIGAALDRDALEQRAERDALREGRDDRAEGEARSPSSGGGRDRASGTRRRRRGRSAPSSMAMIGA